MTDVKVSESVAAPAAKVWELLGDFGGVTKWGGSMLQSCSVEGEGVGAVRRIGLRGGMEIAERCEAYDAAKRSFSYSILGKSPIPIKNYVSVCTVVERPARTNVASTGTGHSSPMVSAQGRRRGW